MLSYDSQILPPLTLGISIGNMSFPLESKFRLRYWSLNEVEAPKAQQNELEAKYTMFGTTPPQNFHIRYWIAFKEAPKIPFTLSIKILVWIRFYLKSCLWHFWISKKLFLSTTFCAIRPAWISELWIHQKRWKWWKCNEHIGVKISKHVRYINLKNSRNNQSWVLTG